MCLNYSGGYDAYQDFMDQRLRDHYDDPTELPRGSLSYRKSILSERFDHSQQVDVGYVFSFLLLPNLDFCFPPPHFISDSA